ncbi:NAD-dependent epimerase/dehydratase family protein [Desulfococcus sp.]|uniref:NAD-dependent epimerase/dehydratase family protein n=1 Tax=Desulfococcus sp. TaxID=2025834 RepID=UPI0035938AE4
MRILITGNMGYVGSYLVQHLRSVLPDLSIVGYDMGYFAHCLTNAACLPEHRVDLQYFADIRTISADILTNNKIDAVVHLAAISNDPMGKTYEDVTLDVNYRSSVRLARLAKETGVQSFIFASSCSMYGSADDSAKTETSPLNPLTAYARSKVNTEKELKEIAGDGLKVTCLRFATACGMSDRLRLDLVLNDFVAGAVASKKITILSDGTPWRPLINVKDMALAIEWALSRPTDLGAFVAVNTGSDRWNYQVRELAEAAAEVIPGVEVSINTNAEPDKRSYRVDFSLFKQIAPHHQPRYDLTATIRELQEGLEAMRFSDPNFRNSYFMRLKVLNRFRELNLLTPELNWAK